MLHSRLPLGATILFTCDAAGTMALLMYQLNREPPIRCIYPEALRQPATTVHGSIVFRLFLFVKTHHWCLTILPMTPMATSLFTAFATLFPVPIPTAPA